MLWKRAVPLYSVMALSFACVLAAAIQDVWIVQMRLFFLAVLGIFAMCAMWATWAVNDFLGG